MLTTIFLSDPVMAQPIAYCPTCLRRQFTKNGQCVVCFPPEPDPEPTSKDPEQLNWLDEPPKAA